jgi:hypothetical protein
VSSLKPNIRERLLDKKKTTPKMTQLKNICIGNESVLRNTLIKRYKKNSLPKDLHDKHRWASLSLKIATCKLITPKAKLSRVYTLASSEVVDFSSINISNC